MMQKSINMKDTHPRRHKQTAGGLRGDETWEQMARRNIGERDKCKQTRVPGGHTHVDHIRDVMDVILGHHRVGRCQVQQVVVPGFCALQLVLRVLGLSLEGADARDEVWNIRADRANLWERALERTPPAITIRIPSVLVQF